MRAAYIFGLLERYRNRLVQLAESCPEEKRNVVPTGFNNSIHWQIGHVLTVTDRLAFALAEQTPLVPAHYTSYFGNGTKPADWQDAPPSWDSIIADLKAQPGQIQEALGDKLELPVKENFLKAENIGELIAGGITHECTHLGNIMALMKVLK
ncbi:DinB family protein [Paenibacillus cremeus]|nr:DinB family protein [Paenibacillus cremeus]